MSNIELETIWNKAMGEKSWKSLVPYPRLLVLWQNRFPQDNIRIATVSSHKLGNHKWCDTPEKCQTVQTFIEQNSPNYQQKLIDRFTNM